MQLFSTGEAARLIGIPRWKLQYLIERNDLPESSQIVANRRAFTEEDITKLRSALEEREAEAVA